MPTIPKPTPRWLYALHAFIQRLPIPPWLLGVVLIVGGVMLLA